ncbi:MAG: MBL fold metallo-hydrolase [Armatimonadetes bacterium]|nr:MBL fold metallo-hydrolase [Armatimonadota bacterium]
MKALSLLVDSVTVSPFQTNCYIIACPKTKEGIILDPGDEPERILAVARFHQITVTAIVSTHGHLDHVLAVGAVKRVTGAPFLLPELDLPIARTAHIQARLYNWFAEPLPDPDGFLREGQTLTVGEISLKVLHLPGHTPGHIALYHENPDGSKHLFSGDVLFAGSVGRTDLPGGNWEQLQNSLKRLMSLPEETIVYSGHGRRTTIGEERRYNPFVPK